MNKEQLLELGLSDEIAEKVLSGFGHMVPKTRLDEVITEKNELKSQLNDRDTQLKELAKSNKDNEELQTQIKELQAKNTETEKEYTEKLAKMQLDSSIELELTKMGAKNNKAVKAMLELDKVKFENDKLVGLSEQLETLKTSDGYLFKETEPSTPAGVEPKVNNPGSNIKEISLGGALKSLYTKE